MSAARLGIVIERALLLGGHHVDALHEVLVLDDGRIPDRGKRETDRGESQSGSRVDVEAQVQHSYSTPADTISLSLSLCRTRALLALSHPTCAARSCLPPPPRP